MDDDWLEDTSGPFQGGAADPLTMKEYERIAMRYSDAGYREGITDGKLATLQEGFDQSFSASVPPARRLGQMRGRAAALLALSPSASDKIRDLVQDLNRVKRDDVLPRDIEREQHEREEHETGDDILDINESREMEGLENALEGMGNGGATTQEQVLREGDLLDELERRLKEVEVELRQSN